MNVGGSSARGPRNITVPRRIALAIAVSYAVLGGIWIVFSDRLLPVIVATPEELLRMNIVKGLAFILVTSSLLYALLRVAPRAPEEGAAPRTRGWLLLVVFVALASAILAVGYFVQREVTETLEVRHEATLRQVASLKAGQVEIWLDRKHDLVEIIAHSTRWASLAPAARDGDPAALAELRIELGALTQQLGNEGVQLGFRQAGLVLADTSGVPVAAAGTAIDRSFVAAAVRRLRDEGRGFFHTDGGGIGLQMAFTAATADSGVPAAQQFFLLMLVQDPINTVNSLHEIMARWPAPEAQGAAALARLGDGGRLELLPGFGTPWFDGDAVAFPVSPALDGALQHRRGIRGGYLGEYVAGQHAMLALARVPGTEWIVAAVMDRTQAVAGVAALITATQVAVLGAIVIAGWLILLLFREQRAHSRALLANVVRERDALDQHFSYLSRFANDIVLLSDATGRIVNCNDRAVSAYGRPRESLIGCALSDLCPPAVRAAGERGFMQALDSGDSRFETWQHSTHRGEFPVEISARTFTVDGEQFIQSIVRDVSAQRLAEQQLRASEARFRNTFDHSAVGIAHVSVDGRFIMVNQHFADLLGYAPEEMRGMQVWSLSVSEDLPRELQMGKALLAGERGDYVIEKRYRRKDGELLWAHLTVSAVRAENSQVEYLIGVVADIGPRKQLEREVQRRSLLYRTLSETNRAIARAEGIDEVLAAACGIVVSGGLFSRAAVTRFDSGAGEPTVVATAGPKARELAGELLELQARSGIFPVLSSDASPDGTVVINDVESGPISANTRLACLRHEVRAFASLPLGDPMMPEGRFMVFAQEADFFAGDTLDLLLDMARDLSVALARFREAAKREMAEQHAREVAQRMSTLVEAAPIPVYDIDADGLVGELWNPAAERVFGWRREEVRGRPLPIVPEDPAAQAEFAALREKVLAGERLAGVELRRRRRDGSAVYISLSTARIPGSSQTILSVAEDITSRHDAAEAVSRARDELELRVAERTAELSAARDRAEEADRIKTAFLANMSHELRTPLNSIIGFSSLLLSGAPGAVNEEQGKQLAIVRHAGERLLTLIEDILDISRLQAVDAMLPREPAALKDMILRAVDTLRPQAAGRGLSMETDIEPCVALAEPRRLEQVLLNLLSNAVKYTDTGGVWVKCRHVGDHVEVSVEDTGPGISAEEQARLFVPFSQLKRSDSGREGTGLGLAISRRLVEAMGGSISVDSEAGRGSIFTVRLDAARAS